MDSLLKGLMWFLPFLIVLILISIKIFDEDKQVKFDRGHISIYLTMTLIAMYSARSKRLALFGIVFTVLTAFVINYLGVHWFLDITAGIAVGAFAYWSTSTGRMDRLFNMVTDRLGTGTNLT